MLEAASPSEVERGAAAFDEARRALRAIASRLDRAIGELDDAWSHSVSAVGERLEAPLRRTRELLHTLDEAELGRQLRITANGLAAGQARVRDLKVQRAGGADGPYDQQAQQILHDVANAYRDVGLTIGGQSPPPPVAVEEPSIGRALIEAARGDSGGLTLASSGSAPADLFRPAVPTLGLGQPGDPVSPPAAGGAAGSGAPMMPFMPPMGGGGMGGGMGGGPGGGGSLFDSSAAKRNGLQGDPSAWNSGQENGWNVLGRKEQRLEAAREDFRKDFDQEIKKAMRGDRDG
ncbi:hypothetical protein SAMN04489716_5349 [Actinoplanes derwentensis]|uniref:Uncharacterized protein n=1 Tax=Actinoplanes derwentensis TaxID=113562 RepID=A0A1H2C7D3_9ACTN|nr:hypothetical protein Ade03nite_54760 [Actinoplanes derwentensis]SDT66435.1 hypothetical protein SAMN04489716_5349 [Actinoplanes derwentensis]